MYNEAISTTDALRFEASEPAVSAWVYANAGSGKTHVLAARVLRLLLQEAVARPSRILCITYTKAAAAEIEQRILETLAGWAVAPQEALRKALFKLTGETASEELCQRARKLFATVLDAPEGLRMQTIHSFCQSVLSRFPLEARLPPQFTVIDERTANELLREAVYHVYGASIAPASDVDEEVRAALARIAGVTSESEFHTLISGLSQQRRRLSQLLGQRPQALHAVRARLYRLLGVEEGEGEAQLLARHFIYAPGERERLRDAAQELANYPKGKANLETAAGLAAWLERDDINVERYQAYRNCMLVKNECRAREKLFTREAKLSDTLKDAMHIEQQRVLACEEALLSLRLARLNADLLTLADGVLAQYAALKRTRALMDYDDLIISTKALIHSSGSAWIMYKLDGGIDHVLVDEAQDTSLEQWQIVDTLTDEFFAGQGTEREHERTLFVVGDIKQSIFSFQGAAPEAFLAMRSHFKQKVEQAGVFRGVPLPESFRSVSAVLETVDATFTQDTLKAAVGEVNAIRHLCTREGQAGRVEWWPALETDEGGSGEWQLLRERRATRPPEAQLAQQVAEHIMRLVNGSDMLEARARAIVPGDIMVLVQRRGRFVDHLIRALKRAQIPVAGVDRMVLTRNLAVKDLLALGRFLLLPEDDLTLAALLKSPLCGVTDEAQLLELAYGRGGQSVWKRLQALKEACPEFTQAHGFLAKMLAAADYMPPYELYAKALETLGGRARITGRMGSEYHDAIDEFMNQALAFEQTHVPSLQQFVHWMERDETSIRRDMEHGRGEVRVMTVHASKGLQAPVVILADATAVPNLTRERFVWHTEHEALPALPLWSGSAQDTAWLSGLKEQRKQTMFSEYYRLLYVAMTRAEDRLYVMGKKERTVQLSWHASVLEAMKSSPSAELITTPCGEGFAIIDEQAGALYDKDKLPHRADAQTAAMLPAWVHANAPEVAPESRPLTPSHFGGEEPVALSPLSAARSYRRGVAVHTLLQMLPALPEHARAAAASAWLAKAEPELAQHSANIIAEVCAVMSAPAVAPLFGEHSAAEVPLAGCVCLSGKPVVVSGQIDRLAVLEHEVWIVDYKTNAKPPARAQDAAPAYIRQLAAYRALVQAIYPEKQVRCALLWTATVQLMELPAAVLEQHWQGAAYTALSA